MLKYVAFMKVDQPELWSQWTSGPTVVFFKSPIEVEREKIEQWIEKQKKKYSSGKDEETLSGKKGYIETTIIAFDAEQSENLEKFLKYLPFL